MSKAKILFTVAATLLPVVLLSGCLETRENVKEQEEKQVMRKQVQTLQATNADTNSRFQDVDDDVRKLSGRIEALEVKNAQSASKADKGTQALDAKMKENDTAYREEFKKLHVDLDSLKADLAAMRDQQAKAAQEREEKAKEAKESAEKNPFTTAEQKFDQKSWKEAILDYERYRKANPKGKNFATATYKIGVCFEELGMMDDAKAFFDEVVTKFPKSKDAAHATTRLKGLKKK